MAEEAGDVAELVVVVAMDRFEVLDEGLLEEVGPQPVDLGKALADEAEELGVRLLLTAALHNHGWQLVLLTDRQVDLHQLVDRFFGVQGALDAAKG